jgi:hypothetical protein
MKVPSGRGAVHRDGRFVVRADRPRGQLCTSSTLSQSYFLLGKTVQIHGATSAERDASAVNYRRYFVRQHWVKSCRSKSLQVLPFV